MQWLVAWQHQAIAWTNAALSSTVFCEIHPIAISQKMLINL